jgi:hypothetical protein
MEDQTNKNRRMSLVIGGVAVALVVILGIVLFYPTPSSDDMKGTIGGIERADRYRGDQISDAEVILRDANFQNLVHDDDFLNLLESDNPQEAMQSDDYRALLQKHDFQMLTEQSEFQSDMLVPEKRKNWSEAVKSLRERDLSVDHERKDPLSVDHERKDPLSVDHERKDPLSVDHEKKEPLSVDHEKREPLSIDHEKKRTALN